jgi:hypothetical protein
MKHVSVVIIKRGWGIITDEVVSTYYETNNKTNANHEHTNYKETLENTIDKTTAQTKTTRDSTNHTHRDEEYDEAFTTRLRTVLRI